VATFRKIEKMLECCSGVLSIIGAVTLLWTLVRLSLFLLTYVIKPTGKYLPKTYGARTGAWAIVTGASDGIGKGFAEELARDGFNVYLVSRTESKLKELADSLTSQFKVQAKYLALDLSKGEVSDNVKEIKKSVEKLSEEGPVSLLVNNVGVNTSMPVCFEEMTTDEIEYQVKVNITFTTLLTHALIPTLKKNKNSRSAIINLSSMTAEFPSAPYLSVYAGSKAYVTLWSKSVSSEMSGSNIDVLAVSPAYVASAMSGFKKASMLVEMPNNTARDSLNKLGSHTEATPALKHAIQRYVVTQIAPEGIFTSQMMSQLKNTRERLLKKKST
jgi:17beta-estradiol 17-dehydrogenase / very-long-chain 3-oxoacyl-CoA reductase